jgi:hypothetical protein
MARIKKDKHKTQVQKIGDKKNTVPVEILCKDMPECFCKILDYVKLLKFEEKPDYKLINSLLNKDIDKLNITPQYEF